MMELLNRRMERGAAVELLIQSLFLLFMNLSLLITVAFDIIVCKIQKTETLRLYCALNLEERTLLHPSMAPAAPVQRRSKHCEAMGGATKQLYDPPP